MRDEGRIDKDPRNCYPNWIVMDTLNDFPGIIDRVTIDIETDIEKEPVLDEGEIQHRSDVLKERITLAEMSGDLKRYKELFELYTKYEWVLINRRYDYLIKDDAEAPEDKENTLNDKLSEILCKYVFSKTASEIFNRVTSTINKFSSYDQIDFSKDFAYDTETKSIIIYRLDGSELVIGVNGDAEEEDKCFTEEYDTYFHRVCNAICTSPNDDLVTFHDVESVMEKLIYENREHVDFTRGFSYNPHNHILTLCCIKDMYVLLNTITYEHMVISTDEIDSRVDKLYHDIYNETGKSLSPIIRNDFKEVIKRSLNSIDLFKSFCYDKKNDWIIVPLINEGIMRIKIEDNRVVLS